MCVGVWLAWWSSGVDYRTLHETTIHGCAPWCEDSSFPAEACQGVPCVGQSLQRYITKEAEESEISDWQVRDPGEPWHHPRPSWSLKEGEDQGPS